MTGAVLTNGSNVFKSLHTNNADNKDTTKPNINTNTNANTNTTVAPVTTPAVTTPAIETKTETSNKIAKLEKALPYVATGIATASIAVASIAITKNVKSTKALLKKLNEAEIAARNPENAPVTKDNLKTTAAFIIGLLGAATGGAVADKFDKHKDSLKDIGVTDSEFDTMKGETRNSATNKDNRLAEVESKATSANTRADEAKGQAQNAANTAQNAENTAHGAEDKASGAIKVANDALAKSGSTSINSIAMASHRKPFSGINLLVTNNNEKYMNKSKIGSALEDIHTAVMYRTGREKGQTEQIVKDYRKKYVPLLKSNSTWALTAELDPIKAGGLGSVPMEIQNNFTDMGIDNPVFIPMYQQKGKSEFLEYGNDKDGKKFKYIYGGETFDLKKMAEMPVQQYRGDKVVNQNVEFYLGHPKRQDAAGQNYINENQQIIFIKNPDNFGGDIYANNFNADETEKFAFFSKAVYQLAEAKVSTALGKNKTGLGELKVVDKHAFDSVKAPVSMVLNDWHAAPMAGLLRYKAPMENAYNVIDDDVKVALRDMPLVMIGHNAGIPGSTRSSSPERSNMLTENVINTLYDGYAYGITENAATGRGPESVENAVLYERNDNNNRQFNNLAHGVSLSDYYVPVSKNYEKELKEDKQASGLALDIISARKDSDTVSGEINGLDRVLNTTIAKSGWLKGKFGIKLDTYNHLTPIDDVMKARQHNKMELFDNFIKPIMDKKAPKGGYTYESIGDPIKVSREDFENAPVIAFAHRLTPQKGLPIFEKAVQDLFNNWDEKHPGQPKPVIIAGGELEDAGQAQYLNGLKDPNKYKNPDDVNRIQVLQGFMPNAALYSAATYFCAPSTFEPCGLTQGECYAMGTPIITTATGGFVDTIKDGENGFVAPYESFHKKVDREGGSEQDWLNETGKSLAGKFDEGINVFFNDKDKYKTIVETNLNTNLSWNRNSEDDPIHGYIKRLGINDEDKIEANVAPLRHSILPIIKQFDALEQGKITKEKFEESTHILDLVSSDANVKKTKNERLFKPFKDFSNTNKLEQKPISESIQDLNLRIEDCKDPKDSAGKGKLETLEFKKGMESGRLEIAKSSSNTAINDKRMLTKMIRMYITNTKSEKEGNGQAIDTNSPEYSDVKEWKNEILQKYSA